MTLTGGWFPRNMLDIAERLSDPTQAAQASKDIHDAMRYTIQGVYTVQQNLTAGDAASTASIASTLAVAQRVASGVTSVTGSALAVVTGLKTVTNVVVSLDAGAAAVNFWVSAQPAATAGTIDIFVWRPTAAGNTTPIAAITSVAIRWLAYGTK